MNRPVTGLWLLLAVAFALFFVYTLIEPVNIFGYEPKQSELSKKLLSGEPEIALTDSLVSTDTIITQQEIKVEPDTTPQTILFIGDSMLDGLSPRLAAYAKASGDTLYSVVWYSSTSDAWGRTTRLSDYIEKIKPSFIFISLGANELFVKDIKEKRRDKVQSIVRQTNGIPFLWIGPPNWRDDTGINDLIRENVPAGCYFRSAEMKFNRRKDGAHPTAASAITWMDSIIRWMPDNHPHPIRMILPEEKTAKPKRIFVHSPQELPK